METTMKSHPSERSLSESVTNIDRQPSRIRRAYLLSMLASAGIAGLRAPASWAQGVYPERGVKLVIGYTPGGAGDALARMMAQKYTEAFSQSFMVENRPGASATIAATSVAKGPTDGYTLFVNTAPDTALAPISMAGQLQYDFARDFAPIGLVVTVPSVLVVSADSPYRSIEDIVQAAKKTPGKLNYGSFGNGTSAHMAAELFKSVVGLDITHVPFKGSAPALVELLAGRVDFIFDTFASAWPHIKAGKLRAFGVTSDARVPLAPNLPTMLELGFAGCVWQSFIGVVAPAATPVAVLDRLYAETKKIIAQKDVQERITSMGMIPGQAIGPAYATFIAEETSRSKALVQKANIRFD
jgi:tripartite-type tricarboxylate transporter receptor subunit TctC